MTSIPVPDMYPCIYLTSIPVIILPLFLYLPYFYHCIYFISLPVFTFAMCRATIVFPHPVGADIITL